MRYLMLIVITTALQHPGAAQEVSPAPTRPPTITPSEIARLAKMPNWHERCKERKVGNIIASSWHGYRTSPNAGPNERAACPLDDQCLKKMSQNSNFKDETCVVYELCITQEEHNRTCHEGEKLHKPEAYLAPS